MILPRATGAALLLAVAAGCGDDERPAAPGESAGEEALPLTLLFPLTAGDRWRVEAGADGIPHHRGVTAVDDDGIAVMHGAGQALSERYRAGDDEVALVSPDGAPLVPILRAPIRPGATWQWEQRQGDVSVACQAEVKDTRAAARVGGLALDGCVEVHRRCEYPAGSPFPAATTHLAEATFCPRLGRVLERDRFRPPPRASLVPADRTERVVGYRVSGAPPWPAPETFDCRSFILLPSDVQAACGAAVQPQDPVAGQSSAGRCAYRFTSPGGPITVQAERLEEPPDQTALDEALDGSGGESVRTHEGARVLVADGRVQLSLGAGRIRIQVTAAEEACPEQSALRLVPLLRSLGRSDDAR